MCHTINIFKKISSEDPFVVHEHDDWVFTLLRDICLPANLVVTPAHYLSDVKKKEKSVKRLCFLEKLSSNFSTVSLHYFYE